MAVDERNARSGRSASVRVAAIPAASDSRGSARAQNLILAWEASPRPPDRQDPARLLHLLENVSDFVGIVGSNNKIVYVNPAGRTLLGVEDAASVAAIRLPDLLPPAMSKRLENEALPAALRDGIWVGESAILTRSGREIAVSQVLIARRAPDGRLDSVAVIMRDIRRRKRREAALQQSEERFRLLIETMDEGYAVTDRYGVLVFVNDCFARTLGYSPSDVIGHALLDFVEEAQRDSVTTSLGQCKESELLRCEASLLRADGSTLGARLSLRRVAAAEAGAAGICAVITDMSAEMKLAQALRDSQHELSCLACQVLTAEENERKRIAADLHDGLGQSLSALKFGVEWAMSSLGGGAIDETRGMLQALVPKVQEALDEVRRMAMNLRPATLDDLGIIATLSWYAREFRTIYTPIEVDVDLRVAEADVPDALKVTIFRIVQEALNNVARHARATRVRLSFEKADGLLWLTVADDGVGFDPIRVASCEPCDRRHGYACLRDRIAFSGGTLAIEAAPGKGVRLRMSWSCAGRAGDDGGPRAGVRRSTAFPDCAPTCRDASVGGREADG